MRSDKHKHHDSTHHNAKPFVKKDPLEILEDLEDVIDVDIAGLNPAYLLVVMKGLFLLSDLLLGETTLDDLACEARAFGEENDAREALFPSSPLSPSSPLFWARGTLDSSAFDATPEGLKM